MLAILLGQQLKQPGGNSHQVVSNKTDLFTTPIRLSRGNASVPVSLPQEGAALAHVPGNRHSSINANQPPQPYAVAFMLSGDAEE